MINLSELKRFSVKPRIGIYFLFRGDELIYIGQSCDIHKRIEDHKRDKIFDFFSFIECKEEDLDRKEVKLIKLFKPKLNVAHKPKKELLPPIFQTESFQNFFKIQEDWTARIYDTYFIAKLPTGMVYSFISRNNNRGYTRYQFKDLKGEVSNRGSVMLDKASGWFKYKSKKYWFEPKNGAWVISTT